ncbi:MAG: DMT family transporter [Chitinophagales bacterium]|nr:DMT family transporter [Chitinophagales bacterium]
MQKEQQQLKGIVLVLLGAALYSTKAIFAKLIFPYGVDGLTILCLRMLFSLPFYIVILFWYNRKNKVSIAKKDYTDILIAGFFGYYLASYLDFYGLEFISASLERLILFIYPTIVLLFGKILYKRKTYSYQYVAIVITYIGVAIAFQSDLKYYTDNQATVKGAILVFLAAISYAFYLSKSENTIIKIGSIPFTAYSLIFSSIIVIIHYSIVHGLDLFHFPYQVYALSFIIATIATVLPTFIMAEGIKIIGSNNMSIIASIGPILTIFMATYFLKEPFTLQQLLGTILVILGILLISKANIKSKAKR